MSPPSVGYRASPNQITALAQVQAIGLCNGWRFHCLDLTDKLSESQIEARLAACVDRFEVLRTRLSLRASGEPAQIIDGTGQLAASCANGSAQPGGGYKVDGFMATLPDPSQAALRMHLHTRDDGGRQLWLATSILMLDGMSADLLAQTLVGDEGAGAFAAGARVLQYADFASWAWRQQGQAAGIQLPDATGLPWPRGAEQGRGRLQFRLDPATLETAIGACRAMSTDLTSLMLAVYIVVLRKTLAHDTLRIHLPASGRTEETLTANLGLFERRLALAFTLDRSQGFGQLVRDIDIRRRRCEQDAYSMPALTVAETTNGLAFSCREIPARLPLAELREPPALEPVSLAVIACGAWASLVWDYDISRVSADLAESLHGGFLTVLQDALTDPERPIGNFCLTRGARAALMNGKRTDVDDDIGLVRRFLTAAESAPGCVAVEGSRSLTFAELENLSARCATYLQSHGVSRGDIVALALPRSAEWIVAALAVLRLGACYAALDPGQPAARLSSLLAGLSPKVTLTQRNDLDGGAAQHLADARFWTEIEATPPTHTIADRDLKQTAYILHTTGSTGVPKAVAVSELSLMNYFAWARDAYAVDTVDAAILHTSLAVDLTVTSLWLPLICGKTVVLAADQVSIGGLDAALRQDRAWLLKATPSHIRALAQLHAANGAPPRLRGVMVLGGEQLNHSDLEPWRSANPELTIYNEYGPTETTIGCIAHRVSAAGASGAVSIGTPIDNVSAYLVDGDGLPIPDEIPGELVVGGYCIAQGYLGDAEPSGGFANDPILAGRAYRTGDRVCRCAGGDLVFLGRLDDQLKWRGFRVEPAEVERALVEMGYVAEAALARIEHDQQGEALIAYCVMQLGETLDGTVLRERLLQLLPVHMVPNGFVQVERIPLGPSGKRDVAALVKQFPIRSVSFATYHGPVTPEEDVLAAVWGNVLNVDRVGVDDDYFALGGDSLRSVQITALAQQRGLRFSLHQLHDNPTIRTLARSIAATQSDIEVEITEPFALVPAVDRASLPNDVEDAYPLNLLQEGMIYHREFSPKSAVYHAICSYRIDAPFDLELMRRSVQDLVLRHPLLRTSFSLSAFSRPLQLVHREFHDPLGYQDLGDMAGQQQQSCIDAWMEAEKKRGFELEEFPLIRFMAHRMTDHLFQLSYSFHHEIVDGWSDALMVTELMTQYMSLVSGQDITIDPPVSTFRDAIHLEQQALTRPDFLAFWQKNLEDVNIMRLPNLRPPKVDKGEREIIKFDVPISLRLSDSIKALAKTLAVPLKTVLLAAHIKVMGIVGNQDDVITYTVGNGRPENRDGHAVIGLFVNSLAFRLKLGNSSSWTDLIFDALRTENALLPYRRYPMAELKRQHGSEPLSETLFFFNNYHVAETLEKWDDLKLLGLKVYAESTFPFCLNAYIEPFTHKLRMRMEYDQLQYSDDLMDDICDEYLNVLEAMVANPASRHDAACLLAPKRQAEILALGCGERRPRQPGSTVLHLIEQCAAATPDGTALRCGGTTFTYADLAACSNRIAADLSRRGIGPGRTVLILMPRCAETIVAMLAVMKTGAAYLPLDQSQPPERLAYIINDAKVGLVLVHHAAPETVGGIDVPIISFAECLAAGRTNPAALPLPQMGVAYVIYTSGTTGRPKGVAIDHAALHNSTCARFDYYPERPAAFLVLSSHAFDSSVAGIFWTLCSGGKVVLPADAAQLDPVALWDLVEQERVSHLLCIPSLYAAMLDELSLLSGPPCLKAVIVAGETCPHDVGAKHQMRAPAIELYNEYGPTEAAVWATVFRCNQIPRKASVPIGRPIANLSTFVLDRNLHPVSFGVQGELYIGGDGLALGYVGDTALTAERFIANPFSDKPGERLYRTGDIVCQSRDGVIEFVGRTDHMVKIQGFRVDLLEIEHRLDQYAAVGRALVQVRSNGNGQELAGYILPAERDVDIAGLREFAKKALPAYMIPSSFTLIDHIPLKQSGKIDYTALPATSRGAATLDKASTPTEEALTDIWKSVLGIDEIGVNQDFLELGGESLRALRIISKVRRAFDVRLPLRSMVTSSVTIAKIAREVDSARRIASLQDVDGGRGLE